MGILIRANNYIYIYILRLDFPLYAVVLSDEIVLMSTPIESRVTVSVDDYLDLFA